MQFAPPDETIPAAMSAFTLAGEAIAEGLAVQADPSSWPELGVYQAAVAGVKETDGASHLYHRLDRVSQAGVSLASQYHGAEHVPGRRFRHG